MTPLHLSFGSLVVMTIANLLTTGCLMMFVWNADRPGPGLFRLAAGELSMGLGLLLLGLQVPFPQATIAAHCLFLTGSVVVLSAVRQFRGFTPIPFWAIAACAVACGLAETCWLAGRHDPAARAIFGSLLMAAVTTATAAAMMIEIPELDRRLYLFSGILFNLHALALIVRAVWAFAHQAPGAFYIGSAADVTVLLSLNFVTKGCCFAIAIASSRKLYHSTRALALHDPLTQLPNRRLLDERIQALAGPNAVRDCSVALIYLDLDNFKSVNDTLGHHAGDAALQILGQRLQECPPERSFAARVGGDEFVLLLDPVYSRTSAVAFMERAVRAIEEEMSVEDHRLCLAVSSGLAMYPDDVSNLGELMRAADQAMYRAKRSPRPFAGFPLRPIPQASAEART